MSPSRHSTAQVKQSVRQSVSVLILSVVLKASLVPRTSLDSFCLVIQLPCVGEHLVQPAAS